MAIAAGAGPGAIALWIAGAFAMFLPLAVCVLELSSRHPDEGGLYVWSRKAFGPFAGFMTGWMYWCSNLPFFPGLLYFGAANALYLGGERFRALSGSAAWYVGFALVALALATWMNVRGLELGRWLNNAGAVARWLATLLLIGLGALAYLSSGSATSFRPSALVPGTSARDLLFIASIAFAWTGPEAVSFMGGEIRDARRTVPRAVIAAAPMIAAIYVLGTAAILVAVPAQDLSGTQGVVQAVESAGARLSLPGVTPLAAALLTLTALGSLGAWLEAVARLPFVAGIDRHLPAWFGRLHPRFGTPANALLTQSGLTILFVLMGQAGTTVRGAYEVLVTMAFLVTYLPFLALFLAAIRLTAAPPGPEGWRVPGGRPVLVALALVGLATTAISIVLSALPPPGEPNRALASTKVIGGTLLIMAAGVATYARGRRRRA